MLDSILDFGELLEVHGGRGQPARGGRRQTRRRSVRKAARFVRTCHAYGIPVVSFVDVPGVGCQVRTRQACTLLHAYAEASVPLLTVVRRHATGIGYVAMGSCHLGADVNLAWPTARIDGFDPYEVAGRCNVDEIIEPADTRPRLIRALNLLRDHRETPPIPNPTTSRCNARGSACRVFVISAER